MRPILLDNTLNRRSSHQSIYTYWKPEPDIPMNIISSKLCQEIKEYLIIAGAVHLLNH